MVEKSEFLARWEDYFDFDKNKEKKGGDYKNAVKLSFERISGKASLSTVDEKLLEIFNSRKKKVRDIQTEENYQKIIYENL